MAGLNLRLGFASPTIAINGPAILTRRLYHRAQQVEANRIPPAEPPHSDWDAKIFYLVPRRVRSPRPVLRCFGIPSLVVFPWPDLWVRQSDLRDRRIWTAGKRISRLLSHRENRRRILLCVQLQA